MKVISGGQTGADRTGLEIARELGLPTGGYTPKHYRTDEGDDPSLADFGLVALDTPDYKPRTYRNVRESDGTVWFGHTTSPGYHATAYACSRYGKPLIENPCIAELIAFCRQHRIATLNVAGNRRRMNPMIGEDVRRVLRPALEALRAVPLPDP